MNFIDAFKHRYPKEFMALKHPSEPNLYAFSVVAIRVFLRNLPALGITYFFIILSLLTLQWLQSATSFHLIELHQITKMLWSGFMALSFLLLMLSLSWLAFILSIFPNIQRKNLMCYLVGRIPSILIMIVLVSALIVVGSVLVIPGLYLCITFIMFLPLITLFKQGVFSSLLLCFNLIRGRWWLGLKASALPFVVTLFLYGFVATYLLPNLNVLLLLNLFLPISIIFYLCLMLTFSINILIKDENLKLNLMGDLPSSAVPSKLRHE